MTALRITENRPSCLDLADDPYNDYVYLPGKTSGIESGNHKGLVFVQGLFANRATGELFERHGFRVTKDLFQADVVVWTGGEDINPKLYNENPAGASGWSIRRDAEDIDALLKSEKKFKVGICRGAQLLNCHPNGGSLWQDVDHHVGNHFVTDHKTGKSWNVNSLHHQQLRLTDKAELVASTNICTVKSGFNKKWHVDNGIEDLDVEAAWYPETRSLLIQWHPELAYKNDESVRYFYEIFDRYYPRFA